jgi:hypothetical protein
MARTRELLFKVFYSSSFTAVFLILIAFVGVAPADKLYESYRRRRVIDIIIVAAAWVLTALIAAFLYGTRLYTNRSILRDIPKTFLPIEREDLPGRNVHQLIQEKFASSAIVAYHAKPRSRRIETELPDAGERILVLTKQIKQHHHHHILTPDERLLLEPKWGAVAHPGWQSPAATDMPNLEYARVGDELLDLIEAKAVNMTPSNTNLASDEDDKDLRDPRALELLTRPEGMGMRSYLGRLADLGILEDVGLTEDFLMIYEQSRYSGRPLIAEEFQDMMRLFAELLRGISRPEDHLLDLVDGGEFYAGEGSAAPMHKMRSSSFSGRSAMSASSVVHKTPSPAPRRFTRPRRMSEDSVPSMSTASLEQATHSEFTAYTAPQIITRPQQRIQRDNFSASGVTRQETLVSRPDLHQAPSQSSFKSMATSRSSRSAGTQGSVIRLVTEEAANRDVGSDLPYEINVNGFGTERA